MLCTIKKVPPPLYNLQSEPLSTIRKLGTVLTWNVKNNNNAVFSRRFALTNTDFETSTLFDSPANC